MLQTFLLRLLPASLRRRLTPGRLAVLLEFMRFGVVGVIGFVVDTATVYATRGALGLYGAGVVAYLVAASCNWVLNRVFTFRGRGSGPLHRQWAMFLATNLLGFVLNRSTYAAFVTFMPLAAKQPVIAVAGGSVAGMFVNFHLSRRLVFR